MFNITNFNGADWVILSLYTFVLIVSAFYHGKPKKQWPEWNFFREFFFIAIWITILVIAGTFK